MRADIFANLSRWQTAQVARHINRPFTQDYINLMLTEFIELHGDRNYGDDHAIVGGLARFDGQPVMVIGHQKGRDTKEKVYRNFGMPNPEGYRKALRLMKMAEQFKLPVITFVDTPGAYPGIGAEERGQAEAIARNLREMASLRTPIIVCITGEGGSGGALAIAVGDRILMLEHSVYAVISPEGCAAILWSDGTKGAQAAEALKPTAKDIIKLGVIDEIIKEPVGGAHRDHEATARNMKEAIARNLTELNKLSGDELVEGRYKKFRAMSRIAE
jgi:acetyl-CoA carboxylase carboxyl transferase subunit alpha